MNFDYNIQHHSERKTDADMMANNYYYDNNQANVLRFENILMY